MSGLALHLIFHRLSPFNCCLSVVLQLDKGDYPENLHVEFYPHKQRSFFWTFYVFGMVPAMGWAASQHADTLKNTKAILNCC